MHMKKKEQIESRKMQYRTQRKLCSPPNRFYNLFLVYLAGANFFCFTFSTNFAFYIISSSRQQGNKNQTLFFFWFLLHTTISSQTKNPEKSEIHVLDDTNTRDGLLKKNNICNKTLTLVQPYQQATKKRYAKNKKNAFFFTYQPSRHLLLSPFILAGAETPLSSPCDLRIPISDSEGLGLSYDPPPPPYGISLGGISKSSSVSVVVSAASLRGVCSWRGRTVRRFDSGYRNLLQSDWWVDKVRSFLLLILQSWGCFFFLKFIFKFLFSICGDAAAAAATFIPPLAARARGLRLACSFMHPFCFCVVVVGYFDPRKKSSFNLGGGGGKDGWFACEICRARSRELEKLGIFTCRSLGENDVIICPHLWFCRLVVSVIWGFIWWRFCRAGIVYY